MKRIIVTTVQQYTIDRIRVSLNGSYEKELIESLSFKLIKSDNTDVTDRLMNIHDSNYENWMYMEASQTFDLQLKENTQIEDAIYKFILYRNNEEIYSGSVPLAHMEDIRIEFNTVEVVSLDTIRVTLKPKNSSYQSLEMMKLLKFSIIDEGGTNFKDSFQSLTDVIDQSTESEIQEFTLKLKPGGVLPGGYYDIRLTSLYKSRTFPIIEAFAIRMPYMTTQPAKISSIQVATQSVTKQTVLSIIFNPFLEDNLMRDGKRSIIRERDKVNISGYFDASRASTKTYSIAGVKYITRIELPLADEVYSLEKGEYTYRWEWDNPIYAPLEFKFQVGWVVTALDSIDLFEGSIVEFDLPRAYYVNDFLKEYHLQVELNGIEIDTTDIFGPLEECAAMKNGASLQRSDHFGVRILDMSKIQDGTYTFLLWTLRSADNNPDYVGEVYYNYMGNIDIVDCLTPEIEEVYQSSVDTLTVILKEEQPIASLIQTQMELYDQYGMINFSDRLFSIENSNVWKPGQVMAKAFDIIIKNEKTLSSGRYLFNTIFRGKKSSVVHADIQHVEARRGFIEKVEQISLNKIRVTFSEPQSRQFLLTTKFKVLHKYPDGDAWYEERFEYLENVLKADQMSFKEFDIMMDHEDSFPAGRYEIMFVYETEGIHQVNDCIYAFDVELGYMTNNIPSIRYVIMEYNEEGELLLRINFKNELEQELYESSIFSCIRQLDDLDIEFNFEDKEDWDVVYRASKQNIMHIMEIRIPVKDVEYTHIERGVYTINFSWKGIIDFMEDLEKEIILEYYLPKLKRAEVVDMDMSRKWARMYFEMPVTMQYSYFENLKVEVLSPDGEDCTEFFDTVFNSNNIDPSLPESQKLPSNSFNLNCLKADQIQIGDYQFIFYTDYTGMKQSDWMINLNIRDGIRPQIEEAHQYSLSQIIIILKAPVPRRLLEEMTIRFRNFNHTIHDNDFMTIDTANTWAEDVREVTEFFIELKGGKKLEEGSYHFALCNGNYVCDDYLFDIVWMEGANGSISEIKPVALNLIRIKFKELESKALFVRLNLLVESVDGSVSYDNRFNDIKKAFQSIEADYFDTVQLEVANPIPEGYYNFRFERLVDERYLIQLPDNSGIRLPFLNSVFPLIYSATATKLGDTMDGNDALIIWFDPPLEKTLFESSAFAIFKNSNLDINVANRFKDIYTDGIIEIETDKYGIEYVTFVTLEFTNMTTLNRDRYLIHFEWKDDFHSYMRPIERVQDIDYILFPFKSIEQIDSETIRLFFKSPVTGECMKRSEVYISTTKSVQTGDGTEYVDADFSNQFLSLQVTNTFEDGKVYPFVDVKMGTRDPEHPASVVLPPNRYRFIISEHDFDDHWGCECKKYVGLIHKDKICDNCGSTVSFIREEDDSEEYGLIYVYGGNKYIDFLVNSESLYANSIVERTFYDRLRYTWDMLQYTQMLDLCTFFIRRKLNESGDIKDYSGLFLDTKTANYFHRLKNDDEYEEGYYEDAAEYVLTIDELQFKLYQTLRAFAKLKPGCAIPAHTYDIGFVYNNNEYFKHTITLPFMTASPPEIYDMYVDTKDVDGPYLIIEFIPNAEFEALKASSFMIMTYRGEYADGTIKGVDVTENFGQVAESEFVEIDKPDPEIRYIKAIRLPISPGAIIPSGRYMLNWYWPDYTFFPDCKYIGGLNLMGIGVESARVIACDMIEVTLEEQVLAKDFKAMELGVEGYDEGNVSDRFISLAESNKHIENSTKTKVYLLKLDDGEELIGDTYRFTLSQITEEDDDDDEVTFVKLETCIWEMTIVYMTTDFPHLKRMDNLSIQKYTVESFDKSVSSLYIGKDVQLLTSNNPQEIVTLDKENSSDFYGKMVKVFNDARIDTLSAEFDEEIDVSLINALVVEVRDDEGNNVSEKFNAPSVSNKVSYRDILYGIEISMNKYDRIENIKDYDFYIETADGRDISARFNSISKSNNFTSDDSKVRKFMITVNEDYIVENYELPELIVRLKNQEDKVITKFNFSTQMQTIKTTPYIDLKLAPKTTISPGRFTFKFMYTNDPDIENTVWLYPWTYTGNTPFLSNNLGVISEVVVLDMEHIDLIFSELSLPVPAFLTFEFRIIDEDGNALDPNTFEDLNVTNMFDAAETLEELDDPGVIHLQLKEGKTIPAGTYRLQFWIEIAANEPDDDNDEEESDDDPSDPEEDNIHIGEYCLWDKYTSLPIMFREMHNSIKSVEIMNINKVKINLEKPIDISIMRDFAVDLYNPLKDTTFQNKFASIETSNFFGKYVMTTNSMNIMHSTDGIHWQNFNTGYEYSYTKCFYYKPTGYFYAFATNGKIIKFNDFNRGVYATQKPVEIVDYGTTVRTSLNDYALIDNRTLIIVGNSGVILRGTIDSSSGDIQLVNVNADKKITKYTLSAIIYNNGILLAVGQKGTILRSNDLGVTWDTIVSGVVYNLNDIVYHKHEIDIEGELPDIQLQGDDEDSIYDMAIPEKNVVEKMDTSGYFICGNNGTILVCNDFEEGFTAMEVGTHKALFSITSREDTIIAVGDIGTIVSIADTIDGYETSIIELEEFKYSLKDIEYCNDKFFICGGNGSWLSSKEGEKWKVNNNYYGAATRSIIYVPSQYDAQTADWFYADVAKGQDIAYINYYSGWDIPTLESDFCKDWTGDMIDMHIMDFYTRFEFEEGRPKPKEFYHFVKKATLVPFEEEYDDIERRRVDLEDVEYVWEQCAGYERPHNGTYYVRLRQKTKSNPDDWIYGTENAIQLPYLTSKDLKITDVQLHSPDDKPEPQFFKPYMEIKMSGANENCFHYVRYEFLRGDTDCTNWFQSIRESDLIYSGGLNVTGIDIYGKPTLNLTDIKKGNYTLRWTWMAPGTAPDEMKYSIINNIPVKNMLHLLEYVKRDPSNSKRVIFRFTKLIDSRFFLGKNDFDLNMRKLPSTYKEYQRLGDTNFYWQFEPIEDCTNFSETPNADTGDATNTLVKVQEVYMELKNGCTLMPGKYYQKMNTGKNYMYEKEDDDNIWVTCDGDGKALILEDELTTRLPRIRDVSLERYTAIPTRDDGGYVEVHKGKGMDEANRLINEWTANGTIQNHLADRYTNTEDNVTYYLIQEKTSSTAENKDYEWWVPSEDPYLCVSFEQEYMPLYTTFQNRYKEWLLDEVVDLDPLEDGTVPQKKVKDLRPWFRQEIEYFEYAFSFVTDNTTGEKMKYISKLYIPFKPDCPDFPGCEYGTYWLKFEEGSVYKDIEFRNVTLPVCVKSYGTLKNIKAKNPSIRKNDPTAGFIVYFQKNLGKDFVKSMDLTVTRILSESEKKKLGVKSNQLDYTGRFKSLYESNQSDFTNSKIDSMNKVYVWLENDEYIDHGKYKITLSADVESNPIFDIEGPSPVVMNRTISCPWLSTNVPKDMKASLSISGTSNPVLTITFTDTRPPKSSIIKSKTNNKVNGKVVVVNHKTKKSFTTSFRPLANSTVKYTYDKELAEQRTDSVESWVKTIKIPMCNNSALPKGTFDVTFKFHTTALLEDIPYPNKYGYTQFKTTQVIITRVGAIDTIKSLDSRRCKITIKKDKSLNTNRKLASSRIGKTLNIKTWKSLLGLFSLRMTRSTDNHFRQSRFYKGKKYVKITDSSITYKIKPNFIFNPYIYKLYYVKGKCTPIAPRHREFEGLIWNKIGKAANDPRVWIILETEPSGKENCRVYKSYKDFLARKKNIRRLNTMIKYKYKLCKQCRKIKLLSTKKITGCINTYNFPYQYKQGIAKFFKQLVKKWYRMRSKTVKITLAKGKKFDKKGNIVKDTKNPNKKHSYKCSTAPFKGFKFDQTTEGKGEERQVSYRCANYVAKSKKWKVKVRIGTINPKQIPKHRSKVYLAMLVYQPPGSDMNFHLKRGYKSNKKGKKTAAYKKYVKWLEKMVEKKKKRCKRCSRCKKREIAEKKNKIIGWGAARFPVQVMTRKEMKNLPKLLNVAEKKGGFKCKKITKSGCKKPKFVWTKVTIKKKAYAKLKCKNAKILPKELRVANGYQGLYYAPSSSVKKKPKKISLTNPNKICAAAKAGHKQTVKKSNKSTKRRKVKRNAK